MRFYLTFSLILLFLCSGLTFGADKFILIGKNDPINNNDRILMDHLQGMGLNVEYHSEPEGHPVKLDDAIGIYISESVTSGNIGPVYNDVELPFIMSEGGLIDEMRMGNGQNAEGVSTINIVDNSHFITQGLDLGELEVLTAPGTMSGATDLEGDPQVLATLADGSGWPRVFVYEKGAQMQGQKAPARRVFVFNHQEINPLLNDDGWTIIERAVEWVLGAASSVEPANGLIATWGEIRSRY
jgi:hypothetical protein